MKNAVPKISKTPSTDEDMLFLLLKLTDFPRKEKHSFEFQQLNGQISDSSYTRIIQALFEIRKRNKGLLIRNLKFNPHALGETMEERLSLLNGYLKRARLLWKIEGYSNVENIINNEFSVRDMRVIAYSPLPDLHHIFRCLNFNINIKESCQTMLLHFLENTIRNFINGQLASESENVCTLAHHKRISFKTICDIVEKCGREILLKKSDFGSHLRFADFVVALHTLGYLEIVDVPFAEGTGFAFKVRVKEKLLDEAKSYQENNEAKKEIVPLDIPPKTNWEDIEIRFLNGDDIKVLAHGTFIETVSSEGLGCVNSKNGSPDKQWNLLQNLSISEGRFDINRFRDIKEKEKFKQQRGALSQRLKKLIGIEDDPIPFDKVKKSYIARFKILPEGDLRGDGELFGFEDGLSLKNTSWEISR